jgi:ribosome biogenesis GTPase
VIDNPGMREFGLIDAEEGFGSRHADIVALAAACRYRDCSHAGEPGCAVQAALVAGELSAEHFESYRKLSSEAAFHRLSSVEKRRKDRDFGRFLKTAKKDWRDD